MYTIFLGSLVYLIIFWVNLFSKLKKSKANNKKIKKSQMQKQKMKNKSYSDEGNYAGRYLPGDPVPQSCKLVICGYCNAENLVPQNDKPEKYTCYFCRERL